MAKTKTTSKAPDGRVTSGSPVQAGSQKRKPARKAKRVRRKARAQNPANVESRPLLEPNAAGIDIGIREMYVAVPPDRDEHPIRVFDTFTGT
jgi:hypothetical protein